MIFQIIFQQCLKDVLDDRQRDRHEVCYFFFFFKFYNLVLSGHLKEAKNLQGLLSVFILFIEC